MWRAFLDQMISDVFGPDKYEESRAWLYDRSDGFFPTFDDVCELAGVKPEWVEYVISKLEKEATE